MLIAIALTLALAIDFAFEEVMKRRWARGALEPYGRERDGRR